MGAGRSVGRNIEGMKVVGVPVGFGNYVQGHMSRVAIREDTTALARHIAAMEDKQVGLLLIDMSLARKTACLRRSVVSDRGREPWQKANAALVFLWAAERLILGARIRKFGCLRRFARFHWASSPATQKFVTVLHRCWVTGYAVRRYGRCVCSIAASGHGS